MYSHLELAVRPSLMLFRLSLAAHLVVLLVMVPIYIRAALQPTLASALLFVVIAVQGQLLWRLSQRQFEWQQSWHWRYQAGRWSVGRDVESLTEVEALCAERVLPGFTQLRFRRGGRLERQTWLADRLEHDAFRRARILLDMPDDSN